MQKEDKVAMCRMFEYCEGNFDFILLFFRTFVLVLLVKPLIIILPSTCIEKGTLKEKVVSY